MKESSIASSDETSHSEDQYMRPREERKRGKESDQGVTKVAGRSCLEDIDLTAAGLESYPSQPSDEPL